VPTLEGAGWLHSTNSDAKNDSVVGRDAEKLLIIETVD